MTEFNSLLELFTVFNFAYVLSHDFTNSLNTRITSSFSILEKELKQIKTLILANQEYLIESQKKYGDALGQAVLGALNKKSLDLESEYKGVKKGIEKHIRDSGVQPKFNFYCLFAGFYSIAILLVFALGLEDSIYHMGMLFCFNFIVVVILIFEFWDWIKFVKCSYLYSTYAFLFSLVVFGIFLFFYNLFHWNWFERNFYYTNVVLIIGISTHHFVLYFIKALYNRRHNVNDKMQEITSFKMRCTTFGSEIEGSLLTVEKQNEIGGQTLHKKQRNTK